MTAHPRVLIVDDERAMCDLLASGLSRRGFAATACSGADEGFATLEQSEFDVVLTDLNLRGGTSGIELCERIVANRPDVPVVVLTAFGSLETAVAAIRAGAYDFITKPVEIDALVITLQRAVQHRSLRAEVKRLRKVVDQSQSFERILGQSPAMKRVFDLLDRVADSEASVLVTGETGTGKELVASALHQRSRRRQGPFVAINCAAMPETLLESQLFGHAKGAFTDARQAQVGLFVQASGGTLFLDEIGDMPVGLQPKILRALQERTVRPLGGEAEIPFDARIVAATNRDLETAVADGRFREDLYFRINVIHVELPPLRARGSDVLVLAQHFVEHFAAVADKPVVGLSSAAAEKLLAYAWPGNVRELQNCVERAVALARYDQVAVEDLPEKIRSYRRSHVIVASEDPSELVPMEEVERRYILRVLDSVGGNKTLAAQVLGFDRKTLYRKLERYEAMAARGK
ncbi:MAG: sigma-54-dependent Fis family transcriptional regulator [Deltaproteobacteria bacterium]|nr:sigma-54-dependent Fis family transcriptional regulator [Deltaproteobacteria bacterium]